MPAPGSAGPCPRGALEPERVAYSPTFVPSQYRSAGRRGRTLLKSADGIRRALTSRNDCAHRVRSPQTYVLPTSTSTARRIASGRSGHASTTRARSGWICVSRAKVWAKGSGGVVATSCVACTSAAWDRGSIPRASSFARHADNPGNRRHALVFQGFLLATARLPTCHFLPFLGLIV